MENTNQAEQAEAVAVETMAVAEPNPDYSPTCFKNIIFNSECQYVKYLGAEQAKFKARKKELLEAFRFNDVSLQPLVKNVVKAQIRANLSICFRDLRIAEELQKRDMLDTLTDYQGAPLGPRTTVLQVTSNFKHCMSVPLTYNDYQVPFLLPTKKFNPNIVQLIRERGLVNDDQATAGKLVNEYITDSYQALRQQINVLTSTINKNLCQLDYPALSPMDGPLIEGMTRKAFKSVFTYRYNDKNSSLFDANLKRVINLVAEFSGTENSTCDLNGISAVLSRSSWSVVDQGDYELSCSRNREEEGNSDTEFEISTLEFQGCISNQVFTREYWAEWENFARDSGCPITEQLFIFPKERITLMPPFEFDPSPIVKSMHQNHQVDSSEVKRLLTLNNVVDDSLLIQQLTTAKRFSKLTAIEQKTAVFCLKDALNVRKTIEFHHGIGSFQNTNQYYQRLPLKCIFIPKEPNDGYLTYAGAQAIMDKKMDKEGKMYKNIFSTKPEEIGLRSEEVAIEEQIQQYQKVIGIKPLPDRPDRVVMSKPKAPEVFFTCTTVIPPKNQPQLSPTTGIGIFESYTIGIGFVAMKLMGLF